MISENDLQLGDLRLLEVDRKVWLPINTHIRVLITANDVLHAWAIPSFGVKIDAVPGRLNQVSLYIKREGIFYGQCSELCGVNHGFMPIVIKAVPLNLFNTWINFLFNKKLIIENNDIKPYKSFTFDKAMLERDAYVIDALIGKVLAAMIEREAELLAILKESSAKAQEAIIKQRSKS
jgi:hypothetical protein